MSGNSIGKLFTLTTAGESHGECLIGIIDGCPPGMSLVESDLQGDLDLRNQAHLATPLNVAKRIKLVFYQALLRVLLLAPQLPF